MKRNKELKKEGYSESNMEECPFQVLAESESEISYHFFFFNYRMLPYAKVQ